MIEIVVWTAMLVGVQALMYWQAASQIEELEHQIKQQAAHIKELQLMTESLILQQEQLYRDSWKTDYRRSEHYKNLPGDGDRKYIIT